MVAILNLRRQIKNPTRQSMHIYLRNNRAKFHPDPIWNDGTFGFGLYGSGWRAVGPTRTR